MDHTPCFSKPFFNPYRSGETWKERFMFLHPALEAYLRQILFVGLRRKGVNYADARRFVYENRLVENFPEHFKTLSGLDWATFIQPNPRLGALWDLYKKQTNLVRHRVFHGLRSYDEAFFRLCYLIDLRLIDTLCQHLLDHFQHDFLPPLKDLDLPRVGKTGVSPNTVIKKFLTGTRPRYSDSEDDMQQLRAFLSGLGISTDEVK